MTKYVIGVSGTHGTGKSSIMKGVNVAGIDVYNGSLSRTAQASLGWDSLSRVHESVENTWALQNAILDALRARDAEIQQSKKYVLVERSPADLWAYTQVWCSRLGIDPKTDERAQEYFNKCLLLSDAYCACLIVSMHPEVPFVPDPNRGDLESRESVERHIKSFIIASNTPSYAVISTGKNQRVSEVVAILPSLIK